MNPTGEAVEFEVIRQSVIRRNRDHSNTEGGKEVTTDQNKDCDEGNEKHEADILILTFRAGLVLKNLT